MKKISINEFWNLHFLPYWTLDKANEVFGVTMEDFEKHLIEDEIISPREAEDLAYNLSDYEKDYWVNDYLLSNKLLPLEVGMINKDKKTVGYLESKEEAFGLINSGKDYFLFYEDWDYNQRLCKIDKSDIKAFVYNFEKKPFNEDSTKGDYFDYLRDYVDIDYINI